MPNKKPILVTGIHRSGSTWVGKVMSHSSEVRYVFEPFNISMKSHRPPFNIWFKYLSPNTPTQEQIKVRRYLHNFIYVNFSSLVNDLKNVNSLYNLKRLFVKFHDKWTKRSIIKDPLAVLSAEWLYDEFNCDVVVLIRHPAAFILSIKEKKWDFDFNNLLNQSQLIKEKLLPFSDRIADYSMNKQSIIDNGILLWNCIYSVIDDYRKKYPKEWYFVKHEDLSLNPISEFQKMAGYLNLEFTTDIKDYIIQTTTAEIDKQHERNSVKNVRKWQTQLTPSEIETIKLGTSHVWRKFYNDNDWT